MGTLWNVDNTGSLTIGNFYKPNTINSSVTVNAANGNEYIVNAGVSPIIQLPAISQLYQRIRITLINSPSTVIFALGSDTISLDENETDAGGSITSTVTAQSVELLALISPTGSNYTWFAVNFTSQWYLDTGILACPQNTLNADNHSLSVAFKNRELIADDGITANLNWSVPGTLNLENSNIINVGSIAPTLPIPPFWINVTTSPYNMVINNGYSLNSTSLVNLTLPSVAPFGSEIKIIDYSGFGFIINQPAGVYIKTLDGITSTGVGGNISSIDPYSSINLVCLLANTGWQINGSEGAFTVT